MNDSTADMNDEKVTVAFRCSSEMQKFLNDRAGEESVSTLLRTWIREKMEAEQPEPVTA